MKRRITILTTLALAAVVGGAVAWADVASQEPIVQDDFNDYTNGSIVGQGSWENYKSGDNFTVQDTTTFEGSKALHINASGDNIITKAGTPQADGRQAVYVRTENRSSWGTYADGNAQFRMTKNSWAGSSDIFAAVSFKSNGNVAYFDPISNVYQNFAAYIDNEWTLVEIEWRSSDAKARYRVNEGTWTDWKTFKGAASFTNFDYVGFNFVLPGGSGGVYFDALVGNPDMDCPERLFGLYCPSDPSPVDDPNLDCPGRAFGLYCPGDPSPVDDPNLDCPGRAFGLYCPDDPSPVDDPNLDCPERAFGLYCPDDPSPEENPNLPTPTPTPTPASTSGSSDGGGGDGGSDGGGGGGDDGGDEPQPTPKPQIGRVLGTSTADRRAPDFISNQQIPAVVDRIFAEVFGRKITHAESVYWKGRARSDKATESKLKGAMLWHKARGSTGPKPGAKVSGATYTFIPNDLVPAYVERVFTEIFGRKPTSADSSYWKHRVRTDKKDEGSLKGAMAWHKERGLTGVGGGLIDQMKGAVSSLATYIATIFH